MWISSLVKIWLDLLYGISWYVVKMSLFFKYSSITAFNEVKTLYLSLSSINTIWTETPEAIMFDLCIAIDSPIGSNSCRYDIP